MTTNAAVELDGFPGARRRSPLGALWARMRSVLGSVRVQRRSLCLCESLPLGEKRLIAVVQFEEQRFLVAATPQNITLLQTLGAARPAGTPPVEGA
jgi:flagellar biogenesis protein FliO